MGHPCLSIVIPCFNGEATLNRCLSSIDQSRLSNQVQVVVVDDGSNDDSVKVANQCLNELQFHGSSGIIQQENKGAPAARNTGLQHVLASRVIFLDVDDFFLAGFVDFMTANWAFLPHDFLDAVSRRIVNEIEDISRVVYDISGKPPATIEWE